MKRGRKPKKNDELVSLSCDFDDMSEESIEVQGAIDIEAILNKLDLYMPLNEIIAEENITMSSFIKCLEYLNEQHIQFDANYYTEALAAYANDDTQDQSWA